MKDLTASFQEILDQGSQAVEGTGVVACVEIDGKQWCGTSGTLDPDDAPRGFYICSLSKTYTAVAIMKLVEKGSLSLDDTLSAHLNEMDPFSEVTLRELLNHTGKIPDYVTFDNYLEDVYKSPEMPWTQDYVSARTRDAGFLDLGEGDWSYSNTGYMYLRQVIEARTRVSFSEAIDELVIRPLALKSTYVASEVDRERALIPAYDEGFRSAKGDIRVQYHPGWCLTGVLVSNVRDVCCLYRELAEGRLLANESMNEVLKGVPTPYWIGSNVAPYNGRLTYGLGLRLCESFPLGPFLGHGGDCPGYSIWAGYLALSDGRNVSSCIVCNASDGVSPDEIWMKLIHCIGGQQIGGLNEMGWRPSRESPRRSV